MAGGPEKKFVIVPPLAATGTPRDSSSPTTSSASSRRGTAGPEERAHAAHARSEGRRHRGVREGPAHADAVWFNGGRQWNIVDSYVNTLTYREFHKVLERGGVIGGSSAGATIQGEYLVRGDTSGPDVMMTAEPNSPGGLQVPAQHRHRSAHQHAQPVGPPDSRHPEVPEVPRHRPLRGDGDHRQGGQVRGDGRVEGRRPRQHAPLPALGEALLRALGRRRLQHEDAQDRKARHGAPRAWRGPRRRTLEGK